MAQAAHHHGRSFAEVTGDLDAGDALERFGGIHVGQLADVGATTESTIWLACSLRCWALARLAR